MFSLTTNQQNLLQKMENNDMATETNRREFEEWAKKQDVSMFTFKTRKGKYYDTITQVAWEAWQAAREQVTEQRDRMAEALRKIKNEQPT